MRKALLSVFSTAFLCLLFSNANAQNYTYATESFESAAWATAGTSFVSTTGTWTASASGTVRSTAKVQTGTYSVSLPSSSSITTPLLNSGTNVLTFYVGTSGSRTITISTSTDGTTFTQFGSPISQSSTSGTTMVLKTVTINDAAVKYVRIANGSGGSIQFDDVSITSVAVNAPTTQASNITFSGVNAISMTVGLTRGNGGNVAIFIAQGSGAITNPTDGSSYTANTTFGSGAQLGSSGYYCIYNGSSATPSAAVTGLTPSTTYTVQAFEYNGTGATSKYLITTATNNPNSQATTAPVPTITSVPNTLNFNSVKTGTTSDKTYSLSANFLSPASGDITITAPAGYTVSTTSGSGYASSITVPYTASTLAATTIYVRFSPTSFVSYSGNVTNSGGSTSADVAVTGNGVQYTVGDFGSVGTGLWSVATTWKKWDGAGFNTVAAAAPTATDNVVINAGHTVTVENAGTKNCKDLFVNGTIVSANSVNSPAYIRINGSTMEVNTGAFIGSTVNPTGDNADGISLDIFSANLIITGTGGDIYLSRMRTNTASSVVTIDHDMTLNYHGGTNQGGHTVALYPNAGDNSSIIVNPSKTLTFAPWAVLATTASSNGLPLLSFNITINGTMNLSNSPAPNSGTPTQNSFIYGGTGNGKTFTLNIGSSGIVNVPEFYPNGIPAGGGAGTGTDAILNIAAGGALNISKIADFRKATQTVTGGGAFNTLTGAVLRIGSTDGITASSALGNIQTTTRGFSTTGVYNYEGTAAQASGDGLPSTVSGLTTNNVAGVTLTNDATVSDLLTLTNGVITTTGKILTLGTAATVSGGSDASYIDGPLTRLTNTISPYSLPVGKGGNYRPVSVTPASTNPSSYSGEFLNVGGPASNSCNPAQLEGYAKNGYWSIQKNSGGDARVELSYVRANTIGQWTADGSNTLGDPDGTRSIVVAHYNGTCWENAGGTLNGSSASGAVTSNALTSFSPFTFGIAPAATLPVRFTTIKAKQSGAGVEVDFTNATEEDVVRYFVERSANGVDFSKITDFSARSNDGRSASYQTTDAAPLKGINYYRIKCEMTNGKIIYSAIAKINTSGGISSLTIYPNPVKGDAISLQFTSVAKGDYIVRIVNSLGQQVYTESIKHNGGSVTQSLQISQLRTGVYQLQFYGEGMKLKQQFVKF